MLQNAYFLAKIGADTAQNEQHFAKKLRKTDNDLAPARAPAHAAQARAPAHRYDLAARR